MVDVAFELTTNDPCPAGWSLELFAKVSVRWAIIGYYLLPNLSLISLML